MYFADAFIQSNPRNKTQYLGATSTMLYQLSYKGPHVLTPDYYTVVVQEGQHQQGDLECH